MIYTLEELKEHLSQNVDEIDLIDALGMTTGDLVERLSEEIEERMDPLIEQFGEECDESEST